MSDAAFRQLADALPHMVWTLQADGRASWVNQTGLDYSGSSLADSLVQGWGPLLHAEDSQQVSSLLAQALVRGEPCELSCRLRRADGVYRWMLGRAVLQGNAAEQPRQWLLSFTDIDDLKRAALQLEIDLSMGRVAGRVARLGGWSIELPDKTLTWSDENCRIHEVPPGYRPTMEEGTGYFLPEHRVTVNRLVQACMEHGTAYEFELPKLTAKGRQIWVRSMGEAVRDAAGNIVRLQGAFQDITEQKLAQVRTLALEAQLSSTLESITDGFCLVDKDWKFVFLNSQAERLLKCRREDVLGKIVWLEFPEIPGTRMEREFRAAVQAQRTTRFETYYPPLKSWFAVHAYPTPSGLAVYFQDITERRAQQDQLRLLETAVSRLNDMVVITQVERVPGTETRIVFVNDAFLRQTGYSREEVLGHSTSLMWGPGPGPAEMQRIRDAVSKWQAVRAETLMYTKAGQPLWVEVDIAPITSASGRFTHWVGVQRDITQRKQQQQEILSLNTELEERVLLRTAELADANKELASFAYSVSHDLRSPLNTIHGFSQLLIKNEGPQVSAKGRHYLDRISAAVEHMGRLIEGLLDLVQLSREELRHEPVDLSAMALAIDKSHRMREPQRQVAMHVQEGLSVQGDARLLAAVLQHLLANAWKFTARQPQAHIEVGSAIGVDGDTLFFVRDNGVGFDMAFAHKLFGTFERLHSPGDFSGNGIGLAMVKRVIERHHGRVWAESQPGLGSTFYFTLGAAADSAP